MFCAIDKNIRLKYEIYGAQNRVTLLMIHGLSMQLTDWSPTLIQSLSKCYRVIVFDNRDVGLSSQVKVADFLTQVERYPDFFQQPINISRYTLFDMAEDAQRLMACLGTEKFHVLGYSMGGMIAQILAAKFPEKVLSLVSLSSSDGSCEIDATADASAAMALSARALPRYKAMENMLNAAAIYAGASYPIDQAESKKAISRSLVRSHNPHGIYRQGIAMRFSGDRQSLLASIKVPSLIIHGTQDPCINVSQGINAAQLINNANLFLIDGLGHDLPESVQKPIASKVLGHLALG